IITYKELCKLEMEIFRQLQVINIHNWGTARSGIRLTQFYGIELDDFAHETAKLSLWLTEHQMNLAYKEVFGESKPTLPLQDSGNIANANAAQENWVEICPKENGSEVYILGNPPYLGFSNQDKDQKADMSSVFVGRKGFKRLDYISCWFWLAAKYITGTNSRFAFVSTNSIAQGEQVGLLWPNVFMLNLEIDFSHQAFKWTNNAKGMAGVTCVVIGVRNKSAKHKLLINNGVKQQVKNISPYLIEGNNSIVMKRGKTRISSLPEMIRGDMPIDGGNLILSNEEKECLLEEYPISGKFIRKFIGTNEFLKSTNRWCLWINDENVREALRIPSISRRVEAVRLMREKSTNKSTLEFAKTPHLFGQIRHMDVKSIIVPRTASERRIYIPVGFVDKETIVSDLASTIPYQSIFVFSIISSSLHMIWVRTVAGGLETRIRYSSGLCYNTFPFPEITDKQKTNLEDHVFNVLDEREKYPEKTMAELYDPDKMPAGLLKAHQDMDLAVEQCYRKKPFKNDEERLEYLFKLYEEMIAAEETGNA
ncbi:MAG: class I SAM-dependent DNA methyltransferase, partial [Candidatus Marinimicrobia bacterium]|nr:class I SAM-dependent DNA methyltransferase [Candidatus Neomarinimicrobiota bacterium]